MFLSTRGLTKSSKPLDIPTSSPYKMADGSAEKVYRATVTAPVNIAVVKYVSPSPDSLSA